MLDRLALDTKRIEAMAASVEAIAALARPRRRGHRPDRAPERAPRLARPRAHRRHRDDLRGAPQRDHRGELARLEGRERHHPARGLRGARVERGARGGHRARAREAGLPADAAQVVPFTDRDGVRAIVQCQAIDLAIPRGGEALIRFVTENAQIPVVQHYKGVCHLFLDAGADVEWPTRLVLDAQDRRARRCATRWSACSSTRATRARLLPPVARALLDKGCELRGCERAHALVPEAKLATDDDWGQEFLAPVLAMRVVDGLEGALAHVARYGSGHTEAICTRDAAHAARWRREVDAACVVVNASTRFHDGGELGLGAEIGIATSRLHWRGPMGLESLTTMKWVIDGDGQTRG